MAEEVETEPEPVPQVEVETTPVALTVRQGLPEDPSAVIVRLVVVALPVIVVEAKETAPPAWLNAPKRLNAPLIVDVPTARFPRTIVEELNVAVLFRAAPPVKVCKVDHVTELAAVTNPGFTKLIVTEPVAFETEIFVPEEREAT